MAKIIGATRLRGDARKTSYHERQAGFLFMAPPTNPVLAVQMGFHNTKPRTFFPAQAARNVSKYMPHQGKREIARRAI